MRGVALVFLKKSSNVTIGGSTFSGSGGGGGSVSRSLTEVGWSLGVGGLDKCGGGGSKAGG